MAFPTSPTNGQQANINGITYTYSNTVTAWTVSTSVSNSFVSISVSGNVNSGNVLATGLASVTGNITGGNLSGTSIAGTLTTAAQTNITSVGTLGSLTVTANTTSGNLLTGGLISATGNITGGNILGGANVNATTHTGTTVSVTANVTGGNLLTGGLISAAGNISANNATFTSNQTLSYGTANGVVYLNSSKVATSGTALVFDGTNLGIGTTTPSTGKFSDASYAFLIQSASTSTGTNIFASNSDNSKYIGLWSGHSGAEPAIGVKTGNAFTFGKWAAINGTGGFTENMRIDSSGNLLVNTTGNIFGSRLAVVGAYPQVAGSFETNNSTYAAISCYASQGNYPADQISFYSNVSSTVTFVGKITSTTSSVSYGSGSDYRLKNNITPMTGALAKVALLNPVAFKWNVDGSDGEGFIAHELQTVIPIAVSGEKDEKDENGKPRYQTVDTSFLVATLTAAIQEQQALITQLTARITALEGA